MSDNIMPENMYMSVPDSDYHAEMLEKKLKCTLANFAQVRFKHYMKMRISLAQPV